MLGEQYARVCSQSEIFAPAAGGWQMVADGRSWPYGHFGLTVLWFKLFLWASCTGVIINAVS